MAEVLEKPLYDLDYYAWTKEQAAKLRELAGARSNLPLDLENLAEEVESLGRSDLRTCKSQIRRIIEHLLKLEYSPAVEPRFGWQDSVIEARTQIEDVLTATLRSEAEAELAQLYARARRSAARAFTQHGEQEAADAFPETCPYDFEQIIDEDWYPANRHGHDDPAG
jgi:hypothetical protein